MPEPSNTPEPLSEETVRRVAFLSRLAITDAEVHTQTTRLSAVLEYVERLRELDLENVEPMHNPTDVTNRVDEDTPRQALPTEALMKMAPGAHPPFVKVPKVLGEGGGA